MEIDQAAFLANCIENAAPLTYEIKKIETVSGILPKFHQWTNGKHVLAAFEVTRVDSKTSFYFLLIDWHRNGSYYLVIYLHNKSTTAAEIREIKEIDGIPHILWKYIPLKRDGKNDQRRAYFKQMFGSTTVEIKLPSSSYELEKFFDQMFSLCQNRLRADRIVDIFDF